MNSCFELARDIKQMDFQDPDFESIVACKIKKLIHEEKFQVYSMMFLSLKYGPKKLRAFKKHVRGWFLKNAIEAKIETHDCFRKKPYRNQIYGLFDWKK